MKDYEVGRSFADLLLDSIGVEVATQLSAYTGRTVTRPGLTLGLGVEVPLSGAANGVWLRLASAVRWSAATLEGDDVTGGRSVLLTLGIAYHHVVSTHLVDWHDQRVE
ncbi:MAG: hypothetical protein NVS3B20_26300 [Polyangiales bacterium]